MYRPGYIELLNNGELERRVNTFKSMLKKCELCPHKCGVDRTRDGRGICRTSANAVVSGAQAHFGEERELVGRYGSGTIFFSFCNLACVFCQNYRISHYGSGRETTAEELSEMMLGLQNRKCHNINLVSPGHVIPQIVEAIYLAAGRGLSIPIVYNTNGYDLTSTLKLLEGIVDIYMPDIKIVDSHTTEKYLGFGDYFVVAKRALKEMYRQVGDLAVDGQNIAYRGLLVRHLVMPGNIAGTAEIMNFIAQEISKETYVNIMAQYFPSHRAQEFEELRSGVSNREYNQAVQRAIAAGLNNIKTFC